MTLDIHRVTMTGWCLNNEAQMKMDDHNVTKQNSESKVQPESNYGLWEMFSRTSNFDHCVSTDGTVPHLVCQ